MAGIGREVAAAQDCVTQNKIDLACKHWQAIVVNLDKLGPPLNESRGDVVAMMQQNKCELIPAGTEFAARSHSRRRWRGRGAAA